MCYNIVYFKKEGIFINNGVLTFVLLIALIMSLLLFQAAQNVKHDQDFIDAVSLSDEEETPDTIDAEFFKRYDINQLSLYYPSPEKEKNKTLIEVPLLNQYPELPVGCEVTSATAILNYLGYDVDKVYLQEEFLEDDYEFIDLGEGRRMGPDPNRVFVGDPKTTGFGCYAPVVVNTLNKYFISIHSNNRGMSIENANSKVLELFLDNGIPLIVWASIDMKPYKYPKSNEWILNTTGEVFDWKGNSHALILIGYDEENYYFSDCNNKTEYSCYPKELFLKRWKQNGKQAVIINLQGK